MSNHTARGPYGSIDEAEGARVLKDIIQSAHTQMKLLEKATETAVKEKNTQAKTSALEEVIRRAQGCLQLYSGLAYMKNCRFIDYDLET